MLNKCVNCIFYVRRDDEYCLNCGFGKPGIYSGTNKLGFYQFLKYQAIAFAVIFSASFLLVVLINEIRFVNFSICVVFSLLFSVLCAFILMTVKSEDDFLKRCAKSKNTLREKEKIIGTRVAELSKRERQINTVSDKIVETDNQNLQEIRRKLMSAREIVLSHFARYELQKQKIELVRLQNGVAPYLVSLQHLNDGDTENGLVMVEITRTEIDKMRRNLTNDAAIEFPTATLREKDSFLAQIDDTKNSCEQLRESLLSRQAVRALQDVSPLRESLQMPNSNELVHAAETFNIQTTLTDFSKSFDELEHEYKRLRAENEIGEKLLAE